MSSHIWKLPSASHLKHPFLFQIEVLYFAKSAEIAGVRSETISVPQEIKALQLWKEIETLHPG